jgi:hypothetical protein
MMNRYFWNGTLAILLVAALAAGCERSPTDSGDHTLGEVRILDLNQNDQVVATWRAGTGWDVAALPPVRLTSGNPARFGVRIFSRTGTERTLTDGGEYSASWALGAGATTGIVATTDTPGRRFFGDRVHVYGLAAGSTNIQFVLMHFDHADGATTPIAISVVP